MALDAAKVAYLDKNGLKQLVSGVLNTLPSILYGPFWGACGLFGEMPNLNAEELTNTQFGDFFQDFVTSRILGVFDGQKITSLNVGEVLPQIMEGFMNEYESTMGENPYELIRFPTSSADIFRLACNLIGIMGVALGAFQTLITSAPLPFMGSIASGDITDLVNDQPDYPFVSDDRYYLGGEGLKTYTEALKDYMNTVYLSNSNATLTYATKTQITNLQTQINGKQQVITYGTTEPTTLSTGNIYVQYE